MSATKLHTQQSLPQRWEALPTTAAAATLGSVGYYFRYYHTSLLL